MAVSIGHRNDPGGCLGWFHPAERLFKPAVEFVGDGVAVGLVVDGQGRSSFVGVRMNHRVDETVRERIPAGADTRFTDVSPGS
jgi:hypothetical protein